MSPSGNAPPQPIYNSSLQVEAVSSVIAMPGSAPNIYQGVQQDQLLQIARLMAREIQMTHPAGAIPAPGDTTRSEDPLERFLDERIDRLRDASADGDPDEYIRLFKDELSTLPQGVSGILRFRLKANIGLRHHAKGDLPEASRWLLEAFEEAPDDPRAISNKVIALWAGGDAEGAYRYGVSMLLQGPSNEVLASYLPQVAAVLPTVEDPFEAVSEALRKTEPLVVAHAIFLRQRDLAPDWWEHSRSGLDRFPNSEYLKTLTAFSYVDEVCRFISGANQPEVTAEQRAHLARAGEVLDAHWRRKTTVLKNRFDDGQHALSAAMLAFHLLSDRRRALELARCMLDILRLRQLFREVAGTGCA